jgi:hypothetical protein
VLRRGGPVLARQRVSLPTVGTARAVTSRRDRVAFPGVRLLPNPQPVQFGLEGGPVDHRRQRRVRRRTSCPDGQSCPSPIVGSFTSLRASRAVTGLPQGVQRVCPVRGSVIGSRRGTAGGPTGWGPPVVVARSSAEVSMSRASGVGPCVPRAAGGPVDLDRYPLRGGPRFHQVERCVRAGVGEQPCALSEYHGADEQVHLVDKLVVE